MPSAWAVNFAVPGFFAVTKPLASTSATSAVLLFVILHFIVLVVASSGTITPVTCFSWVGYNLIVSSAGTSKVISSTTALTVTFTVSLFSPTWIVIVAWPTPIAVTRPDSFTDTTPFLSTSQVVLSLVGLGSIVN